MVEQVASPLKGSVADDTRPSADLRSQPGDAARVTSAPDRKPIIFLELNELCPALLDKWMGEGLLPNFKAFHDGSQVYVTDVDVDSSTELEPWIQWYSMHTGLAYEQHKVFHLTDGPRAGHADIWEMLRDAGLKAANCSSMNAKAFDAPGTYFIPDPWCTSEQPTPAELGIFHKFVSSNVQEYTNPEGALAPADYVRFVTFMLGHGLRPGTILAILRQLATEKFSDAGEYWRRVVLMDRMLFDVFSYYQRRLQPDFSTFFANSIAHLQHAHWREMDPEAFSVKPSAENQARYEGAILFGYQQMDRLIGEFIKLADSQGAILAFATALSQQPFLKYEETGGQHFYRVREIEHLLDDLGIAYTDVQPTMTHQYTVLFENAETASDGRRKLETLNIEGKPVFGFDPAEENSLYFGCTVNQMVPQGQNLNMGNKSADFFDIFYRIEETKSGCHHPDGVLWFRTGSHARHVEKASILDVTPTLLDYFGVHAPNEVSGQFRGRVLDGALPG